jgi:hypothetical protein
MRFQWTCTNVPAVAWATVNMVAGMMALLPSFAVAAAPSNDIPDLSASGAAWQNTHYDFLLPASGPGPVTFDPAHPFKGNNTLRVADLSNPILQPWVRDVLKKFNDDALAGKEQRSPISLCRPGSVPGVILFRNEPLYFAQTPKVVTFLYQSDHQVRHVYLNVPHSKNVQPSWYGESVGHYEGDTLVVDTIGLTPRAPIDYYLTPHTDQLHVVERYHRILNGKILEVVFSVEDPGAFTMPWTASQRFRELDNTPLEEYVCAEGEPLSPQSTHLDF